MRYKGCKIVLFPFGFCTFRDKYDFSAKIYCQRFAPTAPAGECGKCLTLKDADWMDMTRNHIHKTHWIWSGSSVPTSRYLILLWRLCHKCSGFIALTSVSTAPRPPSGLARLLLTFWSTGGLNSILKPHKFQGVRECFCIECALAFSQNGHKFAPAVRGSIQLKYPARTRVMH